MTTKKVLVWAAAAWAWCAWAEIGIVAPTNGEVVAQLNETQAKFVRETMAEREKYFDGAENAKVLKHAKSLPKPIALKWTGGEAPFKVTVKRAGDGKTFLEAEATKREATVDSLEIARKWEWTVTDAKGESATGTFETEDQAPRLIRIAKVGNARDLGGRRGIDGRRIRQGLLFRTSGLNDNAPTIYYTLEEVLALHKEGKLAAMGSVGKSYAKTLDKGGKLDPKFMRLVKKSKFAPGKERLTPAERKRVLDLYGFKTDVDLRGPSEVYGMTNSPLGSAVKWVNVQLKGGYGGFADEKHFGEKRAIFKTLFDRSAYPIVFHCIGGADRTGTIAFMTEALLGVDEDQLALDYLTTGFVGGVSDPRHKGWFDGMVKTYRALPGATPQDKLNGLFLKMGFAQGEIDAFREFMLEPKETK